MIGDDTLFSSSRIPMAITFERAVAVGTATATLRPAPAMTAGNLVVVFVSSDDGVGGSNKIQTPTSAYVDRFLYTNCQASAGGLWSRMFYGICTTGAGSGTIVCDLSGAPANYG